MDTVTIPQITDTLRKLPVDKLEVVYDFVLYLADREVKPILRETAQASYQLMLASESVLARDWNKPEEDAAWASL